VDIQRHVEMGNIGMFLEVVKGIQSLDKAVALGKAAAVGQ
jgi:hypothetical protein